MQIKQRFWWFLPLILIAAFGVLAYSPSKTYAKTSEMLDEGYGLHGYMRQSAPITPEIRVQAVRVTANTVFATLCIKMPTSEPWNPYATLRVNGNVIPNSGFRLLHAKDPDVMKSLIRCYEFTFPYKVRGTSLQRATIKLENLWLELGRGYWDKHAVAKINERAQKFAPGLNFEIVHVRGQNGGGAYIKFHSLPPGISPEEATRLIQRLGIDEIPVNWETEITLNK